MRQSGLFRNLTFVFIGLFMISLYMYVYAPKYVEFANKEHRQEIALTGGDEKQLEEFDRLADQRKFSAETIALTAMLFTALGTLSTLVLGWRNVRNIDEEAQLRIKKLVLEIEELHNKTTKRKRLAKTTTKSRILSAPQD